MNMNGNNRTMQIDVERLMEEIDRRAASQWQSLPRTAMLAAPEPPAPDMFEECVNEAFNAQEALNASIIEALAQSVAHAEDTRAQFADEVASLRAELARLRETTEQLKRSTLGLLYLVQQSRQHMTQLTTVLAEVRRRQMAVGTIGAEETVRELGFGQEKVRTELIPRNRLGPALRSLRIER